MKRELIIVMLILFCSICLINGVSAHESEYPEVHIDTPISNTEVSGEVDITATVDDHYETQYVNFTVEHVDSGIICLRGQDANPVDGWSYKWDTSNATNGRYYISARAMNAKMLAGQYNILVTLNNTQSKNNIIIESVVCNVNESNNIVAYLKDLDSNPIVNKNVEFNIDGASYSAFTGSDGAALISFIPSEIKDYEVLVKFNGDNQYFSSQATIMLKALPNTLYQTYGSYLGGNGFDKGKYVHVDKYGDIYVVMESNSNDYNTTSGAFQSSLAGARDLVVSKFSKEGELLFLTYFGGNKNEMYKGLEVDKNGNIYIIGFTQSTNFPITDNAFMKNKTGIQNAFLSVFNTNGSLIYSTLIGGENIDRAFGLAIDDNGNAYIEGITNSVNFPVTNDAFQKVKAGPVWNVNMSSEDITFQDSFDLFLTKINIFSGNLEYATYFGGETMDTTEGSIAVDENGIIYFGGYTSSLLWNVTDNAYQKNHENDVNDAFLTVLNPHTATLLFSTYLGGSDDDIGGKILLSSDGYLYYVGDTFSSDFLITDNAFQKEFKGAGNKVLGGDAFIMKINITDWSLVYSTYFGGLADDGIGDFAIDEEGNLYLLFSTESSDFPITDNAYQKYKNGFEYSNSTPTFDVDYPTFDSAIVKLNAYGSKLLYSTYYGGSSGEQGFGFCLNKGGFILFIRSYSSDLYVLDDAYQAQHGNDTANSQLNRTGLHHMDNYLGIFSNPSTLVLSDITADYDSTIQLTAYLKESLGNGLSKRKVTFYINGKKIGSNLTDKNGIVKLNYKVVEKGGRYVYTAVFEETLGNGAAQSSSTLFVPRSELYITMISNKSNVRVGDKFKITYKLVNNGPNSARNVVFTYKVPKALAYINAIASVGSVKYDSKTKKVVWTIPNLLVGNHTLKLIFKSITPARNNLTPILKTTTYDESVAFGVPNRYLTVKSYAALIGNKNLVKYFQSKTKYKVRVIDENGKIVGVGVKVKMKVGNKVYIVKTDKKGWANFAANLKAGKYRIKVSYKSVNVFNDIIINPTLTAKNISKKKAKIIKFKAKLVNSKGKALKFKKITFKFKAKTYKIKTNKKGIAALNLKKLKVGKYKITTIYGKSKIKRTIKIKK